jgi:hypothetical protein
MTYRPVVVLMEFFDFRSPPDIANDPRRSYVSLATSGTAVQLTFGTDASAARSARS